MLIVVDPHSGVPVYRQLMDQIKFHIASGVLAPGDELPSTRSLSAELGVNPMTISKAYSFLEREDVIERRPGRPLVVKGVAKGELTDRRMEQVRQSLAGPVTVVRQLGVTPADALRVFEELLAGADSADSSHAEDEDA
jgi:GntR family transcriptional regulator